MANKVFDKETLLDLIVNGVPLFILLFFVGVFAALPYFGATGLATGLQYGIVVGSFIALSILTYLAAKAIAGSEIGNPVYLPGQASVDGAKPIEEREEERVWELEEQEKPAEDKALAGGDDEADETAETAEADAVADEADTEAAVDAEETDVDEGAAGEDADAEAESDGEESPDTDADEETQSS